MMLVHCHAGCDQDAVIAGLQARGLWGDGVSDSMVLAALGARKAGSQYIAPCVAHDDLKPSMSLKPIEVQTQSRRGVEVAWYNYQNASGEDLYQVVRFEPKSFSQRYRDGRGGWIFRKHPEQVLYHLPEILRNRIIFLVEGEKDADTLRSWGFVGTTAAGGANAPWLPTFTAALAGKEVVVIPDGDQPGRKRAATVMRELVGHCDLKFLELDNSKDITEWFERGHSEVELIAAVESAEVSE